MRRSCALVLLSAVSAAAEVPPRIPVREGLTVVTAVSQTLGDYESIKRIVAVSPSTVRLTYSSESAAGQRTRARRGVRREDMRSAREYRQGFAADEDATFPGTTALGTSTAVLAELRAQGRSDFACMASGLAGGLGGSISSMLQGLPGVDPKDLAELNALSTLRGTLSRVGDDVAFPVLVNDRRVELRAVKAAGRLGDEDAEFLFLDDPENPLTLRFRLGREALEVVKISFPGEGPEPWIEDALKAAGRAELYGIYFDFGKDTLRDESGPVLDQIAATLSRNPAWRLRIEGHTDSVGGDAANQDLSRRRAEAVKAAIVGRRTSGERLSTAGFGALRPRETNDTLAGRARNRRVELVLEGHAGAAAAAASPAPATSPAPVVPALPKAPPAGADAVAVAKGLGPLGSVLFKDDFSDPKSGWEVAENEDKWIGYAESGFRLLLRERGLAKCLLTPLTISDARIEVDVTRRSGDAESTFGVLARIDDSSRANPGPVFYRFLIDGRGGAAVEAVRYKGYSLPAPMLTPHPAVKPGNATNRLRIDLAGDTLAFSVNGQPVGAIREGSTARGQVGFFASTRSPLDLLFEDFTVWQR